MYKSNKYIALAALASAAMHKAKIVGTALPQSKTEDFLSTNVITDDNKEYTVIAPRSKSAALNLVRHTSILLSLNIAREHGDFNISTLLPVASCPIQNVGKAYICETIIGKPLDDNDLFTSSRFASAIAKALASLHSLDETIAIDNSLPIYSVKDIQNRLLSDLDEGMQTRKLPEFLFSRWEKMIEDVSLWRLNPCMIHSNLSADSFYVKNYVVTGMSDFSDMHIGDPAQDFAWLFGVASPDTISRVFTVYNQLIPQPNFDVFVERAKLHSELVILKWLLHGVRSNNQDIVNDASQMLEDLADSIIAEEEAERIANEKAMRLQEENRRMREEIEKKNAAKLEEMKLKSTTIPVSNPNIFEDTVSSISSVNAGSDISSFEVSDSEVTEAIDISSFDKE